MQNKTSWFGGLLLVVSLFLGTFFSGCGGDNAHDGKSGLTGGSGGVGTGDALSSIQKNIFQANANGFIEKLSTLESTLKSYDKNLTEADVETLQRAFIDIVQTWKAVEVSYVIGDYDDLLLDIPRIIDFFIKASKNQSIPNDVQHALDSTTEIKAALFKNTSKSIQALEFLVYGKQATKADLVLAMNKDNYRRIDALKVVVESLKKKGSLISDFYNNDKKFIANTQDALDALVNALVQSSFDLQEKRIGEAAGFIIKTRDNPDAKKLEYYNSKNSIMSVKAILKAHDEMMGQQSFANLGSFASANGATAIVTEIREKIDNALVFANEINSLEDELNAENMSASVKKLYSEVKALEGIYHTSLINSLDLTARIIDADGD